MPVRILHLHSTFALGGKEARAVRLMNAWGDRAVHTIVSAMPDQTSAREAIAPGISYEIAQNPPPLTGKPSVARYQAIAGYLRRFDLVLTYNWGAMDGVMARRLFGGPPLVHHEDGFNEDEADKLKFERNVFRRLAFPGTHAVVVPSHTLEEIARKVWKQKGSKLHRIPNGIPVGAYAPKPRATALFGLRKREGELVVGTLAGLRAVKDLPRLVRAVAGLDAKLVIVGEGPEREAILLEARRQRMSRGIHLPGFLPNPHRYVGLFDVFALSSKSEQFPISVVEAMAAAVPVAAFAVGDVARMVSPENAPFIVPADDEAALRQAIAALLGDADLRVRVGRANQAKARAEFDETAMIARYAALYGGAMGQSRALTPEG